jgi:hypothetical protein
VTPGALMAGAAQQAIIKGFSILYRAKQGSANRALPSACSPAQSSACKRAGMIAPGENQWT